MLLFFGNFCVFETKEGGGVQINIQKVRDMREKKERERKKARDEREKER